MDKEEFRSAIKKHGFNLSSFAEFIDLEYTTVSKWGKTNPVPRWIPVFLDLYEQLEDMKQTKYHLQKMLEIQSKRD